MSSPDLLTIAQDHLGAGRGLDALNAAKRALQAAPNDGNAVYLMAASLRQLNRMDDAEQLLVRLNRAMPGQADILNMLGLTLRDQGRPVDARQTFEVGCKTAPPSHPVWGNLALLLQDRDPDAAINLYNKMIQLDPNNIEHKAMLAAFQVLQGETERAGSLADAVIKVKADHLTANSVRAEVCLAADKPETARKALVGLLPTAKGPSLNLALAWRRLARAHDALDATDDAFAAWSQANAIQRSEWSERWEDYDGPRSLGSAQRLEKWFADNNPAICTEPLEGPAPVFQVGFPRSGTTLLENMLTAHPNIVTLQEQDSILPIIEAIGDTAETLGQLDDLSVSDINSLRAKYWKMACPNGALDRRTTMVDKYPTNLVWVGILGRIFPDAKIILCLRDPRDCILSAFQQHFAINPEMYRTLTLSDCAALYDACMGAGLAALEGLPKHQVVTVRYEDLIADYESELRAILQHLELPWNDAIYEYRALTRNRRITTPSASQVVQPLYTRSLGKWRRYGDQMQPVLKQLDRWVTRFDYEDANP
jgi:Tfp pilus assembly protein PilF